MTDVGLYAAITATGMWLSLGLYWIIGKLWANRPYLLQSLWFTVTALSVTGFPISLYLELFGYFPGRNYVLIDPNIALGNFIILWIIMEAVSIIITVFSKLLSMRAK